MWKLSASQSASIPLSVRAIDLVDDPAVGLDQDLAILGEPLEQEVADLDLRVDHGRRSQPTRQRLEPVEAEKLGPDRCLAPRIDEGRGGRVGRE